MSIHRSFQALFAIVLTTSATQADATEGGGNSYPIGVETQFSGLMAPEGLNFFGYYQHYESASNRDNDGNANARFAYYKIRSDTVSLRLSYVWPGISFLGANVETRFVQAVPTVELSLGVARPASLGPLDRSGSRTGLADAQIAPILLGWHSPTFHQTAGVETFVPTGTYDVNNRVSTGRHYYQVAPIYAFTWFPRDGFDLNLKLRYAVNGHNTGTGYQSGDEASFEYSGGYRFTPKLTLGASGYVYRQTTADRQNGVSVNGNGNRGRVDAAGPYLSYGFQPELVVIAKLQREFDVRNRPAGTRIWLQTKFPF